LLFPFPWPTFPATQIEIAPEGFSSAVPASLPAFPAAKKCHFPAESLLQKKLWSTADVCLPLAQLVTGDSCQCCCWELLKFQAGSAETLLGVNILMPLFCQGCVKPPWTGERWPSSFPSPKHHGLSSSLGR